jgi:hypothetical protein
MKLARERKSQNCLKTNVASDLGGSTEQVASRKIFARMCDFLRKLAFFGRSRWTADISPGRLGPVTKKNHFRSSCYPTFSAFHRSKPEGIELQPVEKMISNKTAQ